MTVREFHLKPIFQYNHHSNILKTGDVVKLADFGLAIKYKVRLYLSKKGIRPKFSSLCFVTSRKFLHLFNHLCYDCKKAHFWKKYSFWESLILFLLLLMQNSHLILKTLEKSPRWIGSRSITFSNRKLQLNARFEWEHRGISL